MLFLQYYFVNKEKKFNKIFLSLALVFILAIPMLAGCSLSDEFGGKSQSKEAIAMHTNFKTEYFVGDELDVSNGKIEYTNTSGEKTIVAITTEMVSGFSTSTVGSKQLIITYKNKTLLIDYKVDPFKIGTFYYHYEGKLSEYSVEKEHKNTNYFFQFNANGTGVATLPEEGTFTWKYLPEENKIKITGTQTQNVVFVEIISSTCIRLVYENQDLTHIFRHD